MTAPWAEAHVDAKLNYGNIDRDLALRLVRSIKIAERAARQSFQRMEADARNYSGRTADHWDRSFDRIARSAVTAATKVRAALNTVPERVTTTLHVEQTGANTADLRLLSAALDRIRRNGNTNIVINVTVHGIAEVERLALVLRSLPSSHHINVNANSGGVDRMSASLGGMLGTLGKFTAIAGSATVAVGAMLPGLAALAAALAAVGAAAGGAAAAGVGALALAAGTLKVGLGGMSDAFSAMGKSATGGGAADTARDLAEQAKAVRDAEYGLSRAVRDEKDAQKDVARARDDARKKLRDLDLEMRGAVLSEKDAQLDLADAKAELAAGDFKNGRERARAVLRVEQAEQRLMETQRDNADFAREAADTRAKGVEGSDEVVAAQQKLADATHATQQAQDALNEARNPKKTAASGGSDPFADAMAKLSGNARAFVLAVQAVTPAWNEMKRSVQDQLFAGLAEQVRPLADNYIPLLGASMRGVAAGFNEGARSALGFLNSTTGLSLTSTMLGYSSNMAANFGRALGNLVPGIAAIGAGASQVFAPMTDGIAGATKGLSDMLVEAQKSGQMQAFFTNAVNIAKQFGAVLGQVGGIVAGVFRAAGAAGTSPLAGILGTLTQIQTWVNGATGQNALGTFFTSAQAAMAAVVPVLLQVAQVIGTQVAPIIAQMVQQLAPVLLPAIQAVGQGLAEAAPQFVGLAQVVGGLVISLTPFIPTLVQFAPAIMAIVGGIRMWSIAQAVLNVALSANPIGLIVIAIAALVAGIVWVATQTTFFQTVWEAVWGAVKVAWDWVWGVLSAGFSAFVRVFTETIPNAIGKAKDWIVQKFTDVVNFFKSVPDKIKSIAGAIFEPIRESAKAVFNGIAKLWNNTVGRLSFTVPGWLSHVPGMGGIAGKTFSVPQIPLLAAGGRLSDVFRRATGMVRGSGGPTDDKVPALLSNRESVNTAASTARYWPIFSRLNAGMPLWQALRAALPAFAEGGLAREPYGLPVGTNISYGSEGFPQWVYDIGKRFNVKPSTYAGHQERDGQNKGIDWSGSVDDMQKFAEFLRGDAAELEQVIWMNPNTGEQIGVADGQLVGPGTSQPGYYRDDWAGHTDHVHTRQSYSFGGSKSSGGKGIDDTPSSGTSASGSTPIGSGIGSSATSSSSSGSSSGGGVSWGNSGGGSKYNSAADAQKGGVTPVWVENWPAMMGGGGGGLTSADTGTGDLTTTADAPAASTVDTIPLKKNPDGTYSSSDPAWDHLMQRESGGKADRVQEIQDANSGGNEASGLFQIAKQTWAANGGTKYAPTAGEATPEQQAEIAAEIFNKSGGAPWGSGMSGRESDDELRAGIQRAAPTPAAPAASPNDAQQPAATPPTTATDTGDTGTPTTTKTPEVTSPKTLPPVQPLTDTDLNSKGNYKPQEYTLGSNISGSLGSAADVGIHNIIDGYLWTNSKLLGAYDNTTGTSLGTRMGGAANKLIEGQLGAGLGIVGLDSLPPALHAVNQYGTDNKPTDPTADRRNLTDLVNELLARAAPINVIINGPVDADAVVEKLNQTQRRKARRYVKV
ncbi:transglycosylase family protein [Gordonia jacobaea]|uniref:transglycosylase family protein n=1 Tax=Gordonia jacobaea TaxID=122202 RepID=UPI003D710BA5